MPKFEKEFEYYKDYYNKFYGGLPYLTQRESDIFKRLEEQLKKREATLTEKALERLQRMGTAGSGVGQEFFTKTVTEPIESAYAQLDWQKLAMEEAERQRRENIARTMALRKIEEERQGRRELWGTIGKVAGGIISGGITGAMAGGLPGALVGAGLGAVGAGAQVFSTVEAWRNSNKIPTDSEIDELLRGLTPERVEHIKELLKLYEQLYGIGGE